MNRFFNVKLYLEGLKKVRLVGIISAIAVLIANASIPLYAILNGHKSETSTPVSSSMFCVPMLLILFLTPFFFLSMYSFLNKRNESDFFHSIPYTRICVLISFLASIFTWIWGIILASCVLTGILWAIAPSFVLVPTVIFFNFGIYAAVSLYIGAFMLVAMTLTGTTTSNIAIACVLMFWFRFISVLVVAALEITIPIFNIDFSLLRFLSFSYWLPSAVLCSFYNPAIYSSASLWIYSALVTIILYGIGIYLYCVRKSEVATKSAPNKKLQRVYQVVFALPFVLLACLMLMMGSTAGFTILLLFAVVIFYLYDLITTKNIRSSIRSTPMLLVLALCGGLFIGGSYLTRESVLEGNYSPEEIQSVRTYEYASIMDMFDESDSVYENIIVQDISLKDPELIKKISEYLSRDIQDLRSPDKGYDYYIRYYDINVAITLQSGRTVGRKLSLTKEERDAFEELMRQDENYRKAFLQIPSPSEVSFVYCGYVSFVTSNDCMKLYKQFYEEYQQLTDMQKMIVKSSDIGADYEDDLDYEYANRYFAISLRGEHNGKSFWTQYSISECMPKTYAMFVELMRPAQDALRPQLQDFVDGKYDQRLQEIANEYGYSGHFSMYFECFYREYSTYGFNQFDYDQVEIFKELFGKLLPHMTNTPTNQNYIYWSFSLYDRISENYIETVFGLDLSEAELEAIFEEFSNKLSNDN